MSQLPPAPSESERRNYYHGLPSSPILIARCSAPNHPASPWTLEDANKKKCIGPVGIHPIIREWRIVLGHRVKFMVDELDWTSIDVLRLGYEDEYCPVTILISVVPNSTSHDMAYPIIRKVMDCLGEIGHLKDVGCEVKEGRIFPQAADNVLSALPDHGTPTVDEMEMSDSISASIGPSNGIMTTGTKGLYLRLKTQSDGERTVLLTCRHAVIPLIGDQAVGTYQHQDDTGSPYRIMQPSNLFVAWRISGLRSTLDDTAATVSRLVDELASRPRTRAHVTSKYKMLNECYDQITNGERELTHWKALEPLEQRVVGHLLYSPKHECRVIDTGFINPWVPDWALIELDDKRFQSRLDGLSNGAFLPDKFPGKPNRVFDTIIKKYDRCQYTLSNMFKDDDFHDFFKTGNGPNDGVVLKYGFGSGLTMGDINGVMSWTRFPVGDGRKLVSEELCIIGRDGSFSRNGDSGAAIWDQDGVVCGMLTNGCGSELGTDVTYATPIERLLQDIRKCGFNVQLP